MAEKILVVDDDLDTLRLVGLMLERQGYSIVAASGGRQALTLANSERPDLILLDVMMPDIDGVEVTRQLRANPDLQSIPIIMFTAKTQLEDKVEGLDAGADAYLTKPTQPRELIAQVKAILGRAKKARTGPALAPRERGCVVGCLSSKGGVGVSTIVVNTGIAIQRQHKKEVVVADFRPGCGTIGPELGYFDAQGLNRVLSVPASGIDGRLVESALVSHVSQVRLLLASPHPPDARSFNAVESFAAIAQHLAYLANFILLDLGVSLTPVNEKVLELCQMVILVIEPVEHSVSQSKAIIEHLTGKGISGDHIVPVLVNRVRTGMQLPLSQVQDQLGRSIPVIFTPAPEQTYQAIVTRTPVILGQPDSVTAQQFLSLAEKVVQRTG